MPALCEIWFIKQVFLILGYWNSCKLLEKCIYSVWCSFTRHLVPCALLEFDRRSKKRKEQTDTKLRESGVVKLFSSFARAGPQASCCTFWNI